MMIPTLFIVHLFSRSESGRQRQPDLLEAGQGNAAGLLLLWVLRGIL